MKKRIIGLLSLGILLFSSCLDLLDTYPKDSVNSATFWKSKTDVELALAGCYKHLRSSTYLSQLKPYLDCMTDNGYCWQNSHSSFSEIKTGILNASTGGVVSNIYNGMYKGITACYIFLENFEAKKEILNYSENESNHIIAEVRFLRAYYLFELVQRFGGVIIYDKVPTVADSKIKQCTKEESLQYIIADLDFAIKNLPDEVYAGHVVRNTAKGLRARVALFMNDWEVVKTLTSEIINAESSGKVAFSEAYDPIFIKRLGQADCREILFSVEYLAPDVAQNLGIEIEGFYYSGLTPYESFVSSYEENDKRVNNWYYKAVNGAYLRPTDNTLFMPKNTTKTGYGCVKFFDRMNPDKYLLNEYDIKTDDDVVLMRFTEIMLMYAEAMVELGNGGTNDQMALECINRIRKRAGLSLLEETLTRQQLRNERRWELAFEGFRLFDLHRWHIAEEVMNGFESVAGTCKFEPHHYLWPFPQSEIDVNPQLIQNPGY
ncbi:MAG TPA: RagB/SusD family nutrient uptake outer membrane protein [Bacteroides togonis]|nr:RagB/SusD family nutrient uptake outer membrane protein [Bacteroides togonis]